MLRKMCNFISEHREEVENIKTVTIATLTFTTIVSVMLNVSYDKLITANHLEEYFYDIPTK